MSQLDVRSFDVWSLLRPLALGAAVLTVPFALLMGVLSLFGAPTVSSDGEQIYGIGALATALLMGAVLPVIMAFNFCLFAAVSLWLYNRVLNRKPHPESAF